MCQPTTELQGISVGSLVKLQGQVTAQRQASIASPDKRQAGPAARLFPSVERVTMPSAEAATERWAVVPNSPRAKPQPPRPATVRRRLRRVERRFASEETDV